MWESLSSHIRLPTFSEKNTGFLHVQSEVIDFCILYFLFLGHCYVTLETYFYLFSKIKRNVFIQDFYWDIRKKSLKWKLLGVISFRFEIYAILKGTQT
jgi:hypothetical protein